MPRVVGISGSLRSGSYNTALLRLARERAAGLLDIELVELNGIPLYNEDLLRAGTPAQVGELKERIRAADGVLFASPEYNYSFSGVMKNAIDWVSRPVAECPFDRKPCAMIGASTSRSGTMRSQAALRQVLSSVNAFVLPKPEVFVAEARQRFSADGELLDDVARQFLDELLAEFASWICQVTKPAKPEASAR